MKGGQKEKIRIFLAELLLHYIRGFFLLVAATPRQPATVTAAATTATAATATRWVDRFGLATRYLVIVIVLIKRLNKTCEAERKNID